MVECKNCGGKVDKQWAFCPACGESQKQESGDIFSGVFSRMQQEMAEMNKMLEGQFEVLDISPMFRQKPKGHGNGFSIKIVSSSGQQPKVSVHTFGDVNENAVKREVYNQFGLQEHNMKKGDERGIKLSKGAIEPKTEIRKVGTSVMVDMELPGIKDARDIELIDLEDSIELRAAAGSRAFFKILKKPERKAIRNKSFSSGKLHLEFS